MVDVMGGVAAAASVAALTALLEHVGTLETGLREVDPLGYVLLAVAGAALAWRTVAPTVTFGVVLALGIAYQASGYPGGPAPIPIVVALYTLAARGRRSLSLGLGLLAVVTLVGARGLAIAQGLETPLLIAFPTFVIAALYVGQMVASRRQDRADQARAADERDRAREEATRRRVEAERLRIARELHDVVAHNISLINVQATMGVHLMPQQPDQAAAALVEIKTASRQALRELRRVLNVLRQVDDDAEPTAPPPGLTDLPGMIASTRTAGLPTDLVIDGDVTDVPAMIDMAAYRIVQESLKNALRYAAPAPTWVTLRYRPHCLSVEVRDEGRQGATLSVSGPGHGIAGMRERATAVGGTLVAGPAGKRGFRVLAELPLPAAQQ